MSKYSMDRKLCEELRDRFMIGDWVLLNGKPHRWEAKDYLRTEEEMSEIYFMRMTDKILEANKIRYKYDWRYFEYFEDFRFIVNQSPYTGIWFVRFLTDGVYTVKDVSFEYVSQLQFLLRACKEYKLANEFKMPNQ